MSEPPRRRTDEEREAARREREARRAGRDRPDGDGAVPDGGGSDGGSRDGARDAGRPAADATSPWERLGLPRFKAPSLKLPLRGRTEPEPEDEPPLAPPPPSIVSRPPPTAPPPPTSARPPVKRPPKPAVRRPPVRPPARSLPSPGDPSATEPDLVEQAPAEGAHDTTVAPAGPGRPRRRLWILAAAGGVIALVVIWFLASLYQPLTGDGSGRVRVTIPAGTSIGETADLLERKGVISSAFFFKLRARTTGQQNDVKQGTFALRRDMSYTAALDALTKGPPPNVVNVTIPEGRARGEVAPIVRRSGLGGSYLRASKSSSVLSLRRYGARRATNLEGFLFPSTYELKKRSTASSLVGDQLRTFKREFAKVDLRAARRKNLTPYDVLIIASMIDREALLARERPIVASVIYNRLKQRIPLGIDATIRFATGNWTQPLRESELAIDSPYNTRKNQGLPPGPIGSPGIAAIRAAANPARTKFLYYVVKPGTCGQHAFSTSDAQFQRDVARYNSERAAAGGKSPDTCKG